MSSSLRLTVTRPLGAAFARRAVMMALLLCAAGTPIMPTNNMKVVATLLAGCVLLVGAYLFVRSGQRPGWTALDAPALTFLGLAVLATIFGVNPRVSFFPNLTRAEGLLDYFVYVPMALAAARLSVAEVDELLGVLLGAGAIIGAIGIAQYYGLDVTTWIGSRGLNYGTRSWGTLANPDFLGGYVCLVLPIGLALAATAADRRALWACGAAVTLLYGALLGSQTRSAWGATALGAIVLSRYLPRTPQVYRRLAALALVLAAVTAAMMWTKPQVSLVGRAASAFNSEDSSMQGKLWIWAHTLPMIRQRPLLGWGFSAVLGHLPGIGTPDYQRIFGSGPVLIDIAHNDLLQVAVNMGLTGVAAYLWIWATTLGALRRAARAPAAAGGAAAAGIFAALIGYFVWLQFLWSHIGDTNVFWVLAGLGISLARTSASVSAQPAAEAVAVPAV